MLPLYSFLLQSGPGCLGRILLREAPEAGRTVKPVWTAFRGVHQTRGAQNAQPDWPAATNTAVSLMLSASGSHQLWSLSSSSVQPNPHISVFVGHFWTGGAVIHIWVLAAEASSFRSHLVSAKLDVAEERRRSIRLRRRDGSRAPEHKVHVRYCRDAKRRSQECFRLHAAAVRQLRGPVRQLRHRLRDRRDRGEHDEMLQGPLVLPYQAHFQQLRI